MTTRAPLLTSPLAVPALAADPSPGGVDVRSLRLRAGGLRFADPATERAYVDWHRRAAVVSVRVASIAGLFGVALAWISVGFGAPSALPAASAAVLGILYPLYLFGLYVCARPKRVAWVVPVGGLGNAFTGLCAIAFDFWSMHRPDVSYGWVLVASFYGFAVVGLRPHEAACSALSYVSLFQALLARSLLRGELSLSSFLWYSSTPWTVFATGLLASALLDRTARGAFRHECIIALQAAALGRERTLTTRLQEEARARELKVLQEELRRQVAERSRDLAEALLRLSDDPNAQGSLSAGDVVEDRYRVLRLIGQGGMGQVYEVERIADASRLALKVMTRSARRSLVRFAREAQIAAQLDHPNLVATLDVGVTGAGKLFLVMELVQGRTLADFADRYGDVPWALTLLPQIARALSAMHAHHVVHRDLKPSNVLLSGTRLKVSDFGVARLAEDEPGQDGQVLTRTDALVGTPLYMAPELGRPGHSVLPAADIFSFGVLAYEILARRRPYEKPAVFDVQSGSSPPAAEPLLRSTPGVPPAVAELVDRALSANPQRRPTAAEIAAVLDALAPQA